MAVVRKPNYGAALVLGASPLALIISLAVADAGPTEPPIKLVQQGKPPGFGVPPGFHPPPAGEPPTSNGNRPSPGEPNMPGGTNVPPRTNGEPKGNKLNPRGDDDVQRGIDEHRRSKGLN